jgi:hypothetical protein
MVQATAKRKQSQRPIGSAYKRIRSSQEYKDIFWGVPPTLLCKVGVGLYAHMRLYSDKGKPCRYNRISAAIPHAYMRLQRI